MKMEPHRTENIIYDGKAKTLFEGSEQGTVVQYFKDDATAFNAKKKSVINGKGVVNNYISEYIYEGLNSICVPTHFIRRLTEREQLVQKAEVIPLEIVVRNVAAGSLSKRLGIEEGTKLPKTIIETYYKNDELDDPMVTESHIMAKDWAKQNEMIEIFNLTNCINKFLTGLMYGIGIRLIDFKLEFGRILKGDELNIVLVDEISPDNCRLWDIKTNEKMDKDRFRYDLGDTLEAYKEVANRLGISNIIIESDQIDPKQVSNENEARIGFKNLKAHVIVTLKNGVLDPQGKAIENSLEALGYSGVKGVRQGKIFDIELQRNDSECAKSKLTSICEKLLANLVIENYNIEFEA